MRNVLTLALLIPHLVIGPSVALASAADEHTRLALILQQLQRIEALSYEAEASAAAPRARYAFDYPRFTHDLERLREGITDYLHPSRAQPPDPVELIGDYRRESPEAQP
ncbi:MAG TPA: RAQPRD family integrative conjugative element protein [Pseudomonas sp.]|nr:RAQPRD family integrative conjugative element protein [Pseudomonas sp.]